MEYKQLYDEFINFLVDNSCFDAFRLNLQIEEPTEPHKIPGYYTLESLVRDHLSAPYNIIMGAFIWEETLEGYTYWSNLSTKWEDYIGNKDN